jgi:hypothetical protein
VLSLLAVLSRLYDSRVCCTLRTLTMSVQHGVVSANVRVDIVQFFSEHVAQDLQDTSGNVHPILTVDAIRFLYSFRNQVSNVIPLFFNVLIPV